MKYATFVRVPFAFQLNKSCILKSVLDVLICIALSTLTQEDNMIKHTHVYQNEVKRYPLSTYV